MLRAFLAEQKRLDLLAERLAYGVCMRQERRREGISDECLFRSSSSGGQRPRPCPGLARAGARGAVLHRVGLAAKEVEVTAL